MLSLSALELTEKCIAIALFLQSAELLVIRESYSEQGIWRWSLLRKEFASFPFLWRCAAEALFPYTRFVSLLCIQLLAACLLFFFSHPALLLILFLTSLLVSIRFRGSFNGGSDSMTLLVLLCALFAKVSPENSLLHIASLWYLGIQCVLSYSIPALVKMQNRNWWTGKPLAHFLSLRSYPIPEHMRALSLPPRALQCLAYGLVAFELSSIAALFSPAYCILFMALGLSFHLMNAYVFGLSRFSFAWLASYPALYSTSCSLAIFLA